MHKNMQKPKRHELICTETLRWLDKHSLLRSTGKVHLKHLCSCLTRDLKMHRSPSFAGEIQYITTDFPEAGVWKPPAADDSGKVLPGFYINNVTCCQGND